MLVQGKQENPWGLLDTVQLSQRDEGSFTKGTFFRK